MARSPAGKRLRRQSGITLAARQVSVRRPQGELLGISKRVTETSLGTGRLGRDYEGLSQPLLTSELIPGRAPTSQEHVR